MANRLAQILGLWLYSFFWIIGALLVDLPFSLKSGFARGLAGLWFYLIPFRRTVILHNLALVFPRQGQENMADFKKRCEVLCRANMKHYVLSLFEIFERFHFTPERIEGRARFSGVENIKKIQASKQGFFFLAAHIGNWELTTLMGVYVGSRLSIVTKALRNDFFDKLWVRSRKQFGLDLLEERGSGLSIIRAIRKGRAVGFILDQHTGRPHGVEAQFLGLKAWCPKGLAVLSQRLECPVVPAYTLRQSNGHFKVIIEKPLEFPELTNPESRSKFFTEAGSLNEAGVLYHIRVCNESMEKWIRGAPEQYLWLHKRFKNIIDYKSPLVWQL